MTQSQKVRRLRNAIAVYINDCNVMQARGAQLERLLHEFQIEAEGMTAFEPLDVDKLPVQNDLESELEMERGEER